VKRGGRSAFARRVGIKAVFIRTNCRYFGPGRSPPRPSPFQGEGAHRRRCWICDCLALAGRDGSRQEFSTVDAVLKELANAGTQFCVPCVLVYVRHALLNRGRRRSRRWMTEQGAAADNACRDGAPGGVGLFAGARAPRDPHHPSRLGSRKLGVQVGRSQCRPRRSRKPPGASRRSIPLVWGTGKRETGPPRGPKIKATGQRSVGCWTDTGDSGKIRRV